MSLQTLTGNDLFEALLRRTEQKERDREEYVPFVSGWEPRSLIMLVHQSTCDCCGATYRLPNAHIFIESFHPKLGMHQEPVHERFGDPEILFPRLRRVEEIAHTTIPHCQRCWNLAAIIAAARTPTKELVS